MLLIRDIDHQLKGVKLIKIEIKGDLLMWEYNASYFIKQEAYLKISSLEKAKLEKDQLLFHYRSFINNNRKDTDQITGIYEIKGDTDEDFKLLRDLYKQLIASGVSGYESEESKNSRDPKRYKSNTSNKSEKDSRNIYEEAKERREAAELLRTLEEAERKDSSFREKKRRKAAEKTSPSREKEESILNKVVNGIKNPKNIVEGLGNIGAAEGLGDFSSKEFFGGAKRTYSEEEVVKTLFVGTSSTTPSINDVSTQYPQPWIFFKLITASILLFYGFIFLYSQGGNPTLVPAIIFSGSFAIPLSTLVLFFELNIRRNVPFWAVIRVLLAGSVLAFFFTQILFSNTKFFLSPLGASSAAFLEEPAKLIALIILTRGKRKYSYILNGLLLGAAVGCGFAAFESSGYALKALAISGVESMISVIQLRGLLSPFMHIVWTAVAGAALWRVQRGGKFHLGLLKKKEFYAPFGIITLCHLIWNSGLLRHLPFYGGYILTGVIAWILALSLVNLGIKQIVDEKAGKPIFKDRN